MRKEGEPSRQPLEEAVPVAVFKAEVERWAGRIGVHPREVHVKPMRRKWASCSTTGRITFDAGLLTQPTAFRTEAIVHELLHLKIPNHGKLFRTLLRSYLGAHSNYSSTAEMAKSPGR